MRKHTKVKTYKISEIRAALNDLIEMFEVPNPEGGFEIRKIFVDKDHKLQVDYEKEK